MTTTPDTTTTPGTTTAPDSTAMEPLARLSAAVGVAATTIDALDPAQYDRPTPCPPMSVGALAEHLVMALRRVALAGRDVPLAEWPIDAADVAAGTWGDALRVAGSDVEQAWADPALLERPTTLPWGTFPGREVLDVYTNEMVIHTWDLATATDQHPEWDPAVLEASLALTARIFHNFRFDPRATDVTTPVDEVLRKRAGVCQDFAHLQLAALRSLGVPARYVSGYLETAPPPGMARLIGADASHAWVSVFCGDEAGWIDVDPTNNLMPNERHITVAWGRDYSDVSPLRGVTLGAGDQRLSVAVDVMPMDAG